MSQCVSRCFRYRGHPLDFSTGVAARHQRRQHSGDRHRHIGRRPPRCDSRGLQSGPHRESSRGGHQRARTVPDRGTAAGHVHAHVHHGGLRSVQARRARADAELHRERRRRAEARLARGNGDSVWRDAAGGHQQRGAADRCFEVDARRGAERQEPVEHLRPDARARHAGPGTGRRRQQGRVDGARIGARLEAGRLEDDAGRHVV